MPADSRFALRSAAPYHGSREADDWDVWEMNVDGTQKRRVFGGMGPYCCSPVYLPDGRVLFGATKWTSRAEPSPGTFPPGFRHRPDMATFLDEYDGDPVRVLTRCNPDGTNPEQITFNVSSDFMPWVMKDGRVLFSSYQHHGHHRGIGGNAMLGMVNPDGTGFIDLAGNRLERLRTQRNTETPREFPDGRIVYCAGFESHGAMGGGWLCTIDPADPLSIEILTPSVREFPQASTDKNGAYYSPYPLPDGEHGYVVHMRAMFNAPVTQIERGWELTGAVSVIALQQGEHVVTAVLDDVLEGAPNPKALKLALTAQLSGLLCPGVGR